MRLSLTSHGAHSARLPSTEYVPAVQFAHPRALRSKNSPGPHVVQLEVPGLLWLPVGHGLQVSLKPSEKVSIEHSSSLVRALLGRNPALATEHNAAPGSENSPGPSHGLHSVRLPSTENVPAAQLVHARAVPSKTSPGLHTVQPEAPGPLWLPRGHAVQLRAAPCEKVSAGQGSADSGVGQKCPAPQIRGRSVPAGQ